MDSFNTQMPQRSLKSDFGQKRAVGSIGGGDPRIVRKVREKPLSSDDVRARLEAHRAKKEAAKQRAQKTASGDFSNAPDVSTTKERLKKLMSSGGFKFSDKERKVLGKILGNS